MLLHKAIYLQQLSVAQVAVRNHHLLAGFDGLVWKSHTWLDERHWSRNLISQVETMPVYKTGTLDCKEASAVCRVFGQETTGGHAGHTCIDGKEALEIDSLSAITIALHHFLLLLLQA